MPSYLLRSVKPAETTLYAELVRRGLPADYARRTAQELDDHRADLLADLRADGDTDPVSIADERLGETRKLAKRIASDYQRRSWFGRWPLVSFLLAPPLVLCAVWYACVLGIFAISAVAHWFGGPGMPAEYTTGRNIEAAWGFYYFSVTVFSFLIPCLVAYWYSRFALTAAQSRAYLLMACLSFGLMDGLVYHQVWINPDYANRAANGFGVYFGDAAAMSQFFSRPIQLAQLLAPVLVGVALLWRDNRRRAGAMLATSIETDPTRLAA